MSTSVGKKKRPSALNLSSTKPIPGTLQTPSEIAQDIAKHCLSPTIPRGITQDMLKRAQEIELQQRQLIMQRGISAYDARMEQNLDDEEEIKSHGSTPTSGVSSSSSMPTNLAESDAMPPTRTIHSVPGSSTSTSFSRRPWELGNITPREPTAPPVTSTPGSASSSIENDNTLQQRRGAKPVSLDVNALKRNRKGEEDPETRAIGEDEERALPSIREFAKDLNPKKKLRFMQLCEEMWDLFHS